MATSYWCCPFCGVVFWANEHETTGGHHWCKVKGGYNVILQHHEYPDKEEANGTQTEDVQGRDKG